MFYGGGTYSQSPVNPDAPMRLFNPNTGYPHANIEFKWSDTPQDPPAANFACDNVYASPGTMISCIDLSTGSPNSWLWHVWDNSTNEILTPSSTTNLFEFNLSSLGNYDISLWAGNNAGSDTEFKPHYIHVQSFPCWTATPSPAITAVPWYNLTTQNLTAFRLNITGSYIGNMTSPLLDAWDSLFTSMSTALLVVLRFLEFPINGINSALFGVTGIFEVTFNQLIPYTVVPLGITARVVNHIPWQIQAIITLGLLMDTMLLLIKGQG
jgi:hypothetical protein